MSTSTDAGSEIAGSESLGLLRADLTVSPREVASARTADADDAQSRLRLIVRCVSREVGGDLGDELVDRDAAPARLGFEPSLSLGWKVERHGHGRQCTRRSEQMAGACLAAPSQSKSDGLGPRKAHRSSPYRPR